MFLSSEEALSPLAVRFFFRGQPFSTTLVNLSPDQSLMILLPPFFFS